METYSHGTGYKKYVYLPESSEDNKDRDDRNYRSTNGVHRNYLFGTQTNFKNFLANHKYSHRQLEHWPSGSVGPGRTISFELYMNYSDFCAMPMLVIDFNGIPDNWQNFRPKDFIQSIELEIGGSQIDIIYGIQIEMLYDLYKTERHCVVDKNEGGCAKAMYIPLPFDLFVGQNMCPMNGLGKYSVRFRVKLQKYDDKFTKFTELINEILLKTDSYCIMGDKKRQDFNQYRDENKNADADADADADEDKYKKEYEIPFLQTQFTGEDTFPLSTEGTTFKAKLNYNHHINFLYFFVTDENNNIVTHDGLIRSATIKLNNSCEYDFRSADLSYYSNKIFPNNKGVYCLPFVPLSNFDNIQEFHDNTINYSHIDMQVLELHFAKRTVGSDSNRLYVFAMSKNILKTWDGMGGIVFGG